MRLRSENKRTTRREIHWREHGPTTVTGANIFMSANFFETPSAKFSAEMAHITRRKCDVRPRKTAGGETNAFRKHIYMRIEVRSDSRASGCVHKVSRSEKKVRTRAKKEEKKSSPRSHDKVGRVPDARAPPSRSFSIEDARSTRVVMYTGKMGAITNSCVFNSW